MAKNAVIYPGNGATWPIASPIEKDGPDGLREACVKAMQAHRNFPFDGAKVEVTDNDVPASEMIPLKDILDGKNP